MNPVYSPGSSGVPYANAKGIGYPGKQVKFCFHFSTLNTWWISVSLRMLSMDKLSSRGLDREENVLAHGIEKSGAWSGFGQRLIWWLQGWGLASSSLLPVLSFTSSVSSQCASQVTLLPIVVLWCSAPPPPWLWVSSSGSGSHLVPSMPAPRARRGVCWWI